MRRATLWQSLHVHEGVLQRPRPTGPSSQVRQSLCLEFGPRTTLRIRDTTVRPPQKRTRGTGGTGRRERGLQSSHIRGLSRTSWTHTERI